MSTEARRHLKNIRLKTSLTFLADFTTVTRRAAANAVGTRSVPAAVGVDALAHGHVALRALPATVADTRALIVLAIATTQHRARGCTQTSGRRRRNTERRTSEREQRY